MKRELIFIVIMGFCIAGFSQEVVSTGGGQSESNEYQLSWTIGEPVISTFTATGNILTQGFHQTKLIVTPISSLVQDLKIKVYPNPTTQKVFIDVGLQQNFHYELYNAGGELLKKNTLELAINEINTEAFANGTYYIKIHDKHSLIRTYKLVKLY